jgi:hypothetical protein
VYVYHLHPIGSLLIVLDRTQRVKDARTEAAKEVDAYKTQKETDFKQFELEVSPSYPLNILYVYFHLLLCERR